jgi:hypothetical protein
VTQDEAREFDPEHALNLIDATSAVLKDGRTIRPGDLYNLLYLAHKTPMIPLWWVLMYAKDLPSSLEAMQALAETTALC